MTDKVVTRVEGGIGRITLNRPKALHALNEPMCAVILGALQSWAGDDQVHLVIVDHAAETRGFCAGGDIRMLAQSGAGDGREARAFFATEYRMNVAIKSFPKPYLTIMDGVTMGGGVGLSVHGSHRLATEHTLFAMPETGIGLFPDVGGGWFLPRLRGELGTWLALTGARLKAVDVTAAGVATHYTDSELLPNLKQELLSADYAHGAAEMLDAILTRARVTVGGGFAPHLDAINRCFAFDSVEAIIAALKAEDSEWAAKQRSIMATKSPETMKVALRQLREGAQCETFEDNMRNEYRIGWRKVQSHDFLEGVRAVIIDKDNEPNWQPGTLEDVSAGEVDKYFTQLGDDELEF